MKVYNHTKIEKKWQKYWRDKKIYLTRENTKLKKHYVLDMFPYPSGDGLHVGHPKGYIATDIYSRFYKMKSFEVLHPMGWDAFGLPAENYAIKNKIHPRIAVERNIKRFRQQLSLLGFSYDWGREINTTDPAYYKWTQWIFLQMFKKGLAYESFEPINWCPSCQTGLANEDLDGNVCERCGSVVEKRPMRQWVLKITKYADRLLNDLDALNWPESIKESQRNWIGKSEGAEIDFKIKGGDFSVKVFTTRADTLFGATYLVLAPEHPFITELWQPIQNEKEVRGYIKKTEQKTEIERTSVGKEKTGILLKGITAINPATKEEIPIFVADYVLAHYGTGAVMAVPAHDERDFQFAKKYNLPIKTVIQQNTSVELPDIKDGTLINSESFNGLTSAEARTKIIEKVGGKKVVKFKLRDWVFSRQRYWGEPIPIIHCAKCGAVAVPEKDLPVKLPDVKSYEPTGTGESPLANISKWVNTKCPTCKGPGKRETNTMPQWAGSSWYYLRYMDPKNSKKLVDHKKEKYWKQVDMYVGGAEHATRHLIYARFWHKFLKDIKVVSTSEPFERLQHVGLILAQDGRKMSKRFGNVVNPDEIVKRWGADTTRLYEMFMGPFSDAIAWNTDNMIGARRFMERVWHLREKVEINSNLQEDKELRHALAKTIQKVTDDIESFSFNTAISTLMIFSNELEKKEKIHKPIYEQFLLLLSPFVPHVTEELWHSMENNAPILKEKWPQANKKDLIEEARTIGVQINGKVRASILLSITATEEEAKREVFENKQIKKWILEKKVIRFVYVPGKIISIVTSK